MRGPLPLLLLALGLLAGCLDPGDASGSLPVGTESPPPAALPPDIHASATMPASLDPAVEPTCEPPTSTCFRYPFTVESYTRVEARLGWTNLASDLDLFLLLDEQAIKVSATSLGNTEGLSDQMEPGAYSLVVKGYASAPEPFTLDAAFSPAEE